MTLTTKAYLEIETTTNATFEFNISLEPESSLIKNYLMGNRGQYIREVYNWLPGTGTIDDERGTGYYIDGGAAEWQPGFSFGTGMEGDSIQWGDGAGGTGQANVTETDASGSGVKAISRMQILQRWLSRTKTDSTGAAKLHWGEWTDGSVAHISSFSSGAFGEPMPVAIQESQLQGPQLDQDVTTLTGTLTFTHLALWGGENAPDWAQDASNLIQRANEEISDA